MATSDGLDRLAAAYGILPSYIAMSGDEEQVSEASKRGVLAAMGIAADTPEAIAKSLKKAPSPPKDRLDEAPRQRCFMPAWLQGGRAWGVTCQLYGVRSRRNQGIGDFEDLARLAELAAGTGADFLGVNPLHALFAAAPERSSPFSPSSRRFLNPLYIALDRLDFWRGEAAVDPSNAAAARAGDLIDYKSVWTLKRAVLETVWETLRDAPELWQPGAREAFEIFRKERGEALFGHALFEALSEAMVEEGHGCGWHAWPEAYRSRRGGAVEAFAREQADRVDFHAFLQWVADRQLQAAQARARAAGMRIGLYLDLAVGVASDGSATWNDPALSVPTARVGAPPDNFNDAGQDWGLAPLSPAELRARKLEPFHDALSDVMRHAGALRIDHAMSLYRLFWIADGLSAVEGAYVLYPLKEMLEALAEASHERRALIVGEDLGVVPPGFRELMAKAGILSYRILYFERDAASYRAPESYPLEAFACVSTHDLPPLKGWWQGKDIALRDDLGLVGEEDAARQFRERADDRADLLEALVVRGLYDAGRDRKAVARGDKVPDALLVALHAYVAGAASRLFGVQLEDLAGAEEAVNVPGTMAEHPNWCRRLPVELEALGDTALFRDTTAAVAAARPNP